ncbi:MAG: DNA-binding transcriptional regulator [Cytophagales bacterium]|nr:DNA-binding transcriptional regulator [Cytophagales bacterium]
MIKIILLTDFGEQYGTNLLKGVTRYSQEHGPFVFCRMPTYYRETRGMEGILKWAKEWKANGIFGQFYNNSNLDLLMDAGIAVVAQDFKERFTNVPNLTGDYIKAGQMGAEYFLRKGYEHFAFYGFKNIVWSRERAQGFEQRLAREGHTVHYFEHRRQIKSRELWFYKPSALSKWLKSLPKPIAIMSCDDNQGVQITEACRLTNIRIPEEVAVLGVDNDEMLCNLSDPPLSSIGLDTVVGGYETARLLHTMIKTKNQQYYDLVVEPTQIVTRNSTDIYATNDEHISTALKYIHNNMDKNLKVEDVLQQVPLSRRSLEKRFQKVTGHPVYEYIFKLRIEKFTEKLLDTDLTIFEIAVDLGLNDSKNIARQFRQVKGCTPLEYRKKYLIDKR